MLSYGRWKDRYTIFIAAETQGSIWYIDIEAIERCYSYYVCKIARIKIINLSADRTCLQVMLSVHVSKNYHVLY